MHHFRCSHIAPCDGKSATGPYRKVRAVELAELERWAAEHVHPLPSACRSCHRVRPDTPCRFGINHTAAGLHATLRAQQRYSMPGVVGDRQIGDAGRKRPG